jgi:hypothetical protein
MADDDTPVADNTPPTPPPTEPTVEPDKPTSPPAHDDSLKESVARLEGIVSGLAARVEQIVTNPTRDEAPVSKPWTHRTFG